MRPRVVMQYLAFGKGSPHGLNADLFLTDWLEHFGFDYDVLTDEDLHNEGADLLSGYKTVLIPTHSEYWSLAMIEGAQSYLRSEEHTSELQSLMRNRYEVFCFKRKTR